MGVLVAFEGDDAKTVGAAERLADDDRRRGFAAWLSVRKFSKLGLELLSVFIGVTLAFWLDNWRANRQQQQSADAVYKSLSDEVSLIARGGPQIDSKIERGLVDWQAHYAKGERPVPYIYMMPRSPRPPTGVWEAAMSSGLINLLDTRLLFCLARYYRRLDSSGDEYVNYKHFVESEVLPYADDPAYFYGANGRLKPRFAGNMDALVRWRDEHVLVVRQAQELFAALKSRKPPDKC